MTAFGFLKSKGFDYGSDALTRTAAGRTLGRAARPRLTMDPVRRRAPTPTSSRCPTKSMAIPHTVVFRRGLDAIQSSHRPNKTKHRINTTQHYTIIGVV